MIQNRIQLMTSAERKNALHIAEAGLAAYDWDHVFNTLISYNTNKETLTIKSKTYRLQNAKRIFVVGIGELSRKYVGSFETILGQKKPVVSLVFGQGNDMVSALDAIHFLQDDVVICIDMGFRETNTVNQKVLGILEEKGCGSECVHSIVNHLQKSSGKGFVSAVYPAMVYGISFVPPYQNVLTKDSYTNFDVQTILLKHTILDILECESLNLYETPKDPQYFENVENEYFSQPADSMAFMKQMAEDLGLEIDFIKHHTGQDFKNLVKSLPKNKWSAVILKNHGASALRALALKLSPLVNARHFLIVSPAAPIGLMGPIIDFSETENYGINNENDVIFVCFML